MTEQAVAVAVVNPQARQKEPFNPNEHLMQIKNKQGANDYLPVQWRLVWFRELCPQGTIETELVTLDLDKETEEEVYVWNAEKRRSEKILKMAKGYALFKATIKDGKGGVATGYKSEKAASFPDYIEKAETGSIGRALAALGYGTQFAPELDEQHRIVDAPVEQRQSSSQEQKQYQQRRVVVEAVPNEQPAIEAPLPSELRARAKELGKDFDAVVKFLFKKSIPDDELTPNDCQFIHVTFEKSAAIRKTAASVGGK